jgi:hypothetical protein
LYNGDAIVRYLYLWKGDAAMTDQNLRELLEKLHTELEHVDVTDEAGRERLRHLDADIRELLRRSGEEIETDESMLERLQDSIDHFEETHPSLTMMLSQMMTILSNAGI